MNTQSQIEQRVMANVGVIYTTRKVLSATALKVYVLVLSALALWKLVWVTRVLQNFSVVEHNGLQSVGNYFVYAVVHTHPAVQLTLAVAACAFVMLAMDVVRSATPRQSLAY